MSKKRAAIALFGRLALLQLFIISLISLSFSSADIGSPIGFASLDGGTTGGKGGKVIQVSDFSSLVEAVKGTEARIVEVSGKISPGKFQAVEVGSNVTILGKSDAVFYVMGLTLSGSKNVIIKNIKFSDPLGNNSSAILMKGQSKNIWVDHCELTGLPRKSTSDKTWGHTIHIEEGIKNVTISYCYFHDMVHNFLICPKLEHNEIDYETGVTIHDCLFEGTSSRNPRIRRARVHIFNTHWKNIYWQSKTGSKSEEGYCIVSNDEARVVVENSFFDGTHHAVILGFKGHPKGEIILKDCKYENVGIMPENRGTAFDPKSVYSYSVIDAEKVADHVKQYAGVNKGTPTTAVLPTITKNAIKSDISIAINNANKLVITNAFTSQATEGTFAIFALSGKKLLQQNIRTKIGDKAFAVKLPANVGTGNYLYQYIVNNKTFAGALQLK